MYESFRPGQKWLDTNGKPIQAHGFSVFYNEADNTFYWYGENKEHTKKGGKIWHWGVRCYTSKDLYNWEDKGLIIEPTPNDLSCPLHPTYEVDRPHIIYCEKTKKYVAWLKVNAEGENHDSQFMCVMQADKFTGPYKIVNKFHHPLQMNSGDFTLVVDKDKKAYIIFERPHFELICATLNEDYTAAEREHSVHYENRKPPFTREAPTYFERNGKKYLFTSGTSGYYPNPSTVAIFDEMHGKYKDLGDPCIGDKTNTTFNSQITCVLNVPNTDLYIALADRWMPQWYVPKMSKMIIGGMERHFRDYKPIISPQNTTKMSGVETVHKENTYKSRYVWLPIEWQGEKPVIRWYKEWKLKDFIGKSENDMEDKNG